MRISLHRVNNGLLTAIILINSYIILAPLIPKVNYWWQTRHHTQQKLTTKIHSQATTSKSAPVSEANTLTVPSMVLDTPVLEGPVSQTYSILDKGVWRWPLGSSPDKGGNTILVGHRFTYTTPKGIFYYMDKVKVGDEIGLVWDNKPYTYKVASVSEVPPTDTDILDQTSDARLTMYTCTPLWNPVHRLVVIAEKEN